MIRFSVGGADKGFIQLDKNPVEQKVKTRHNIAKHCSKNINNNIQNINKNIKNIHKNIKNINKNIRNINKNIKNYQQEYTEYHQECK